MRYSMQVKSSYERCKLCLPKYLIFILLLGFTFACEPEAGPNDNLIIGRWELDGALRNGQSTTLLEGTFFEFFEDGSLKTNFNLSGEEALSKYVIKGPQITQSESDLNLDFSIMEVNDTSLVLKTALKGARYQILLKKQNLQE